MIAYFYFFCEQKYETEDSAIIFLQAIKTLRALNGDHNKN